MDHSCNFVKIEYVNKEKIEVRMLQLRKEKSNLFRLYSSQFGPIVNHFIWANSKLVTMYNDATLSRPLGFSILL